MATKTTKVKVPEKTLRPPTITIKNSTPSSIPTRRFDAVITGIMMKAIGKRLRSRPDLWGISDAATKRAGHVQENPDVPFGKEFQWFVQSRLHVKN
jgi:hypothetical protein